MIVDVEHAAEPYIRMDENEAGGYLHIIGLPENLWVDTERGTRSRPLLIYRKARSRTKLSE